MSVSVMNIVNTIVGSGLLTMPYTFLLNGWLGGTITLILMSIMTCLSGFLLVDISYETK